MTRLSIPVTAASFAHRGHYYSIRYRKSEEGLDDLDEYLAALVMKGRLTEKRANEVFAEAYEHFYGVKGA